MKKSLPTFCLYYLLSALMLLSITGLSQSKAEKIDAYLKKVQEQRQFNGSALVSAAGEVILKQGYGLANMEWQLPNSADTKFRIGSITKQFTAAVILQLVDEGKVNLSGTINDYLTDYREDIGKKVTVEHLLVHTSGIPSYTGLPRFFQDISRNPYSVSDFVKEYCSGDLQFEPGAQFSYNNSGYFLLGAIIEQVTGKSYEAALQERIFSPLGMENSGYDHHATILPNRASGYDKTPTGFRNAPYLDMGLPYAAGSLYSTVEDLYLWDQALYTEKVLPENQLMAMFTPRVPAFGGHYAYGWSVGQHGLGDDKDSIRTISHGGGINGFNTLINRLTDDKHVIILLNNTGGTILQEISNAIINILYDLPYELPKRPLMDELAKAQAEAGIAGAIKKYRQLKADYPDRYNFQERVLNNFGYMLVRQGNFPDAIEVFKLNVEAYPNAFNTYDSLGEAYMLNGDKALAIKNYEKSLALNPENDNAREMLKKLAE